MTESRYRIPPFEKAINAIINFIFYYRLVVVILAIIGVSYLAHHVFLNSDIKDRTSNVALTFTGGSIVIAIFYSIINYEHTQTKFKYDVKNSRETLSFNMYNKMFDKDMMTQFKYLRDFYKTNQELFVQNKNRQIDENMYKSPDSRIAFVVIFNYFESLCIGINQGLMDERFVKEFFKTIFRDYHSQYGTYLDYMRTERNSNRIFQNFTAVAIKWRNEDNN